jgi:hypothetical protein
MPGSVWEYPESPSTNIPQLGQSMEQIADDWVKFFFFVDRMDHPYSQNDWFHPRRKALDDRQVQFHGTGTGTGSIAKTWFLLPGKIPGFYRTNLPPVIPPNNRIWAVMFSPYMTAASTLEYPQLTTAAQLQNLVSSDTGRVYSVEATINGEPLTTARIVRNVTMRIEPNSVIDNLSGVNNVQVYYDGQFVLLQPLPLGETLITSRGYSPSFENDVKYSVYTRRNA